MCRNVIKSNIAGVWVVELVEEFYTVGVDPAGFAVGDPADSQGIKIVDPEDLK